MLVQRHELHAEPVRRHDADLRLRARRADRDGRVLQRTGRQRPAAHSSWSARPSSTNLFTARTRSARRSRSTASRSGRRRAQVQGHQRDPGSGRHRDRAAHRRRAATAHRHDGRLSARSSIQARSSKAVDAAARPRSTRSSRPGHTSNGSATLPRAQPGLAARDHERDQPRLHGAARRRSPRSRCSSAGSA